MTTNEELIEKASAIFAASLDKHLPDLPELANWWSHYDAFQNGEGKTLPQLVLESKRAEEELRVVAEEATVLFNNWRSDNDIETPYNVIDGKGRLYAQVSVLVEIVLGVYQVTILNPATNEENTYVYNMPCATIDSYGLNRDFTLPEGIVFYGDSDSQITCKAFAHIN